MHKGSGNDGVQLVESGTILRTYVQYRTVPGIYMYAFLLSTDPHIDRDSGRSTSTKATEHNIVLETRKGKTK